MNTNTNTKSVQNNNASKLEFDNLSLEQLKRGVELLVEPSELCERGVLISILKALEFRPQDVVDQIKEGTALNAGPVLCLDF